jgi:chromatin structure-remodeling complex subunit RSC1/2
MTRVTRSRRTKVDISQITQNLPIGNAPRATNIQTRRSSAQTSRQEEESPLTAKLTSIWSTIKSHKDTSVSYRNRVYAKLFMSLPDKKMYPDYYEEIKHPISLDIIKQRIDDGEYLDEEAFGEDLELMCENAKRYNVEGSQIHNDAIILQKLARKLLKGDTEKDKDDNKVSTNLEEVEHNGENYRVGDYVHIVNETDPNKPNVAHIHRIWENHKGVRGIYVCWYYHPEQTKHQATHKFYENEVFKTNTFHDHSFSDVIEKCYVLQYKDYISGRPKGSEDKAVYLCESRYNEHQKNFSKIKNWASTMPDGVPLRKIELIKFNVPIIPKKVESALAASFRKTMEKTKAEESRKELQIPNKYENDTDSYADDPFSPSRAITPVRNVRLGRPPGSSYSNRGQTPVQSYTYDSDHYTSYASSSVVHSPYSMNSGYPITSTPLTENMIPPQYEFVASPHEMPISIPQIPPQHQYIPQQYYQAPPPVVQSATPVMPSPAIPNPTVPNPVLPVPKPTRTGPFLEVPPETAEYFARDDEGNLLWFTSPPIDVVDLPQPMHSIEYLHRREEIIERENNKKRKLQEMLNHQDHQNHQTSQNYQNGKTNQNHQNNQPDRNYHNCQPDQNYQNGQTNNQNYPNGQTNNQNYQDGQTYNQNCQDSQADQRYQDGQTDQSYQGQADQNYQGQTQNYQIDQKDQNTSISESQSQSIPHLKDELVNNIEGLADVWMNDAYALKQQLNDRPEYYEMNKEV